MHYILDGYNVIHKTPAFEALLSRSLEHARKALLSACKSVLQSRGDVAKITVIFDGKSDVFSGEDFLGGVEIIYTMTGEDADDRIVDYLRNHPVRSAAVVSDDNYVCNSARAFKVKSVSVAEFLSLQTKSAVRQNNRKNSHNDASGKRISLKAENDITQAYADYLGIKKSEKK